MILWLTTLIGVIGYIFLIFFVIIITFYDELISPISDKRWKHIIIFLFIVLICSSVSWSIQRTLSMHEHIATYGSLEGREPYQKEQTEEKESTEKTFIRHDPEIKISTSGSWLLTLFTFGWFFIIFILLYCTLINPQYLKLKFRRSI